MLGVAPTENSSGGKKNKKVVGGSSLCRKLFWQWIYTSVQPMQSRKNHPILCEIHEWMNRPKLQGTPYRLLTMKTASHAARMLFKRLVEEWTEN